MSERYATSCMAVAEKLADRLATVEALPIRSIFTLAAKGTPSETRKVVLKRIEAGDMRAVDRIPALKANRSKVLKESRAERKLTKKQLKTRASRKKRRERADGKQDATYAESLRSRRVTLERAAQLIAESMGAQLAEPVGLLREAGITELAAELGNAGSGSSRGPSGDTEAPPPFTRFRRRR
jgi:hypothetical protein